MLEACRGSTSQSGVFYLQKPKQWFSLAKDIKELHLFVKSSLFHYFVSKLKKEYFKYLFIILLNISCDTLL